MHLSRKLSAWAPCIFTNQPRLSLRSSVAPEKWLWALYCTPHPVLDPFQPGLGCVALHSSWKVSQLHPRSGSSRRAKAGPVGAGSPCPLGKGISNRPRLDLCLARATHLGPHVAPRLDASLLSWIQRPVVPDNVFHMEKQRRWESLSSWFSRTHLREGPALCWQWGWEQCCRPRFTEKHPHHQLSGSSSVLRSLWDSGFL